MFVSWSTDQQSAMPKAYMPEGAIASPRTSTGGTAGATFSNVARALGQPRKQPATQPFQTRSVKSPKVTQDTFSRDRSWRTFGAWSNNLLMTRVLFRERSKPCSRAEGKDPSHSTSSQSRTHPGAMYIRHLQEGHHPEHKLREQCVPWEQNRRKGHCSVAYELSRLLVLLFTGLAAVILCKLWLLLMHAFWLYF